MKKFNEEYDKEDLDEQLNLRKIRQHLGWILFILAIPIMLFGLILLLFILLLFILGSLK